MNGLMVAQVGPVRIGSEHKIALQTMTTTDTRDVDATVDQVSESAQEHAAMCRTMASVLERQ